MPNSKTYNRKYWLLLVAVGLLALIGAHLSAIFFRVQPQVSLWFLPAGVAIALTLLFGPIGIILTGVTSVLMAPLWGIDGWYRLLGALDAVEPALAWLLYRRYWQGSLSFTRLRDAIAFIFSAPLLASGTLAVVGSFTFIALGKMPATDWHNTISHWWLGNAMGTVAIAPTIILLLNPVLQRWDCLADTNSKDSERRIIPESQENINPLKLFRLNFAFAAEVFIILLLILATAVLIVSKVNGEDFRFQQLSFLGFIPIIWAATRFGVNGGILASSFCVIATLLSYFFTYQKYTNSINFLLHEEAIHILQLNLFVQCSVSLLLGCAITEKAAAAVALAVEKVRIAEYQARAQLNEQLTQLNASLTEANIRLEQSNREKDELLIREQIAHNQVELVKERLSVVTNAAPLLISYIDAQQTYLFNNQTYTQWHDVSCLEITGKSLKEVLGESGYQVIQPYVEAALSGQQVSYECPVTFKNGKLRYVNARYIPDVDEQGKVKGFIAVVSDITERKQAEDALRETSQTLTALIQACPLAIIAVDLNRNVIMWNPAAEQMFGWKKAEILGTQLPTIPLEEQEAYLLFTQKTFSGKASSNVETKRQKKDGSAIDVCVATAPLQDAEGNICGAVAIFTDITGRKVAEQEKEQLLIREQEARKQAEEANRIKDEFLAVLSHELRSPLNPILGWAKLLRSRRFDRVTTDRALETIERNASLQTQLIEDLLDISRIIRGKLSLEISAVNLISTIAAAIETVRLAAAAKSINLIFSVSESNKEIGLEILNISGGSPILTPNNQNPELDSFFLVSGDPNRLQQIVWNLLTNAVKFTPDGGRVEVRLSALEGTGNEDKVDKGDKNSIQNPKSKIQNSYVQIQVIDTGRGINSDFLPYVFEYFRQADSSTTRTHGGLGLGLAIVRHLVEIHGGTIQAESAGENQGATFTVTLPLLKNESNRQKLEAEDEYYSSFMNIPTLEGLRILIVDDEIDTRNYITFVLEQSGSKVKACASAKEVLQVIAQFQPDILISDISMPDTNGYTLLQQVRSHPDLNGSNIPAVALTANAREEDKQRAISAGFQMHIAKPIEPDKLLAAIANIVSEKTRSSL